MGPVEVYGALAIVYGLKADENHTDNISKKEIALVAKSMIMSPILKYSYKLCTLRFRHESLSTNSTDFNIKLRT